MKIVAIIPIKKKSKRIKGKNFVKVNRKPLFAYLLEKVKKCDFDEIYVDSDSQEIRNYCKKNNLFFVDRIQKLAKDNANGNDLLNYHAKIIKADLYFQLFITSPLLKIKTINNCIKKLKNSKIHDSILTVQHLHTWFWFNNRPINYNPKILPRSQDAKPVIVETTGLYGIKNKSLKKRKCRIGQKPFFYKLSAEESLDIDNKNDLDYFKYFIRKTSKNTKAI
tara:strand:- start:35 stop:700 length:666 start_codon:yes stop_codon:yes gene_type:complete